jgi:NADH dehydrogenase
VRVLVAGGTGVVGEAAVRALLGRGHAVRLLARHAEDDARAWPAEAGGGVEPFPGDVTDPASLRGAADGCDAVLHLVGSVEGDEDAMRRLNVDGTRHVVAEAARAGVPHLVYVSSLGAEPGQVALPPHQVRRRGGGAALPGALGRRAPRQRLRPRRRADLAAAQDGARAAGDPDAGRRRRRVPARVGRRRGRGARPRLRARRPGRPGARGGGRERTSTRDLLDRFARLTGREPARVPCRARSPR